MRSRAVVWSVLAHAALFFTLPRGERPRGLPETTAVELALAPPQLPEPAPLPEAKSSRRRGPRPSLSPAPQLSLRPSQSPKPSLSREPSAVELFPRSAMDVVAGTAPRDRAASGPRGTAAEAKARVDGWLADDDAQRRAAAGAIDPAYRVLERRVREEFRPPKSVVKVSSWGGAIRDQLKSFFGDPDRLHGEASERFDRRAEGRDDYVGDSPGSNFRSMPLAQQSASKAAFNEPRWLAAEVEITVSADGTVRDVRLISPSGHRRFDRYATDELRRIAGLRPYALPRAARMRFVMRGAYVAKLPTGFAFRFDETGNLNPRARGAARFIAIDNPVEETAHDVELRSIKPDGP